MSPAKPQRHTRHSTSPRSRICPQLPDRGRSAGSLSHAVELCILVDACTPQASTTANCCGVRAWTRARSASSIAGTRAPSTARCSCDCGDPDVALDLTAETFARALQSIGRFRGPRVSSGRAWIFAIANSLLLQYERERRIEDRARRRLGILEATRLHSDDDSVVARVDAEASRDRLADVHARAAREPAERAAAAHRGRGHVRGDRAAARLLPGGGAPAGLARHAQADASSSRRRSSDGRRGQRGSRRSSGRSSRAAARQAQRRRRRRRRAVVLVAGGGAARARRGRLGGATQGFFGERRPAPLDAPRRPAECPRRAVAPGSSSAARGAPARSGRAAARGSSRAGA